MPDRPILIFPVSGVGHRGGLPSGPTAKPMRPSRAQQRKRLEARFDALEDRFGTIQADEGGLDPEQVIVLETIGAVAAFQNAVRRIHGMEWLADFDLEVEQPDPGFLADGTEPTSLRGRLFVIAAHRGAYGELLRLWRAWNKSKDAKLERGFGKLAEVFGLLHDVRSWSAEDRVLSTGIQEFWEAGLSARVPLIRFEAELWCRADSSLRAAAYARLKSIVEAAGGVCVKHATIPDIDYDGVLLDLPADTIRDAIVALKKRKETPLLRLVDVKYFAPMGQAQTLCPAEGTPVAIASSAPPEGPPSIALLDGLPLMQHAALRDRLILDDPDDLSGRYQTGEHRHGTAMASLIAHGELDAGASPLRSKIYVRPVMAPRQADLEGGREERFLADELAVDLVHRAVRRIVAGDGTLPAQAPSVKAINLSIGDASQPFDGRMSPWARLLDWLSWKFQILFVVSAGNHGLDIVIPVPETSIMAMTDHALRGHTLRAINGQRISRRLLAPAESVNALTVGASHEQAGGSRPPESLVDLLRGAGMMSPISSVCSGFRRAIKPEILAPGGKCHYRRKPHSAGSTSARFEIVSSGAQPGQLVAAPGGTAIPPDRAVRVCGTSNAAALTSRRAAQLVDLIARLRSDPGGDVLADRYTAVILKAMLVHGAGWNDWEPIVDEVLDGGDDGTARWWRVKRDCARFFGYGRADFDRGTVCTNQRVILLGCGELKAEQGHDYRMPLPTGLHAVSSRRRLTVTLAWNTPIEPRRREYAAADLWCDGEFDRLRLKRVDADPDSCRRGTVQHEVLESAAVVAITEGDSLTLHVNCRGIEGKKLPAAVPYALMVSLEVAPPATVRIYEQVKAALEAVRVRPGIRVPLRETR